MNQAEMTQQERLRTSASRTAAPSLAVFDLDGTLVRGDSFLPFLVSYAWRRRRVRPLLVLPFYLALFACRILSDRTAKQRVLISFFRGQSTAAVAEHAEWFCGWWVRRKLNAPVIDKLRQHQEAGHRVVLLSASPDVYVPAVGTYLTIDEVICTRVARSGERWEGTIVGSNCKGNAKVEALQKWLEQDAAPDRSYAYGDSSSDLPLLRWVTNGFLVQGNSFRGV
jgi:phosphatidylglycerophosphatase C